MNPAPKSRELRGTRAERPLEKVKRYLPSSSTTSSIKSQQYYIETGWSCSEGNIIRSSAENGRQKSVKEANISASFLLLLLVQSLHAYYYGMYETRISSFALWACSAMVLLLVSVVLWAWSSREPRGCTIQQILKQISGAGHTYFSQNSDPIICARDALFSSRRPAFGFENNRRFAPGSYGMDFEYSTHQ